MINASCRTTKRYIPQASLIVIKQTDVGIQEASSRTSLNMYYRVIPIIGWNAFRMHSCAGNSIVTILHHLCEAIAFTAPEIAWSLVHKTVGNNDWKAAFINKFTCLFVDTRNLSCLSDWYTLLCNKSNWRFSAFFGRRNRSSWPVATQIQTSRNIDLLIY